MDRPTLDDVIEQLKDTVGVERIDPDEPLMASDDLDSLHLMEWLYTFQDQHPEIPADASLFEDIDETVTLRTIYDRVMAGIPATAVDG